LGPACTTLPDPATVALKDPAHFRIIGHDLPRRDVPAKSTGRAIYAIDVDIPNMAYATVLRAPVEGEVPVRVDDSAARSVAGVIDIVTLPDGIAVVAESLWAALGARGLLNVTWSETSPFRASNSAETIAQYAAAVEAPDAGSYTHLTLPTRCSG